MEMETVANLIVFHTRCSCGTKHKLPRIYYSDHNEYMRIYAWCVLRGLIL